MKSRATRFQIRQLKAEIDLISDFDILTLADSIDLSIRGSIAEVRDRYFRFRIRKKFGPSAAFWNPSEDNKATMIPRSPTGRRLREDQNLDQNDRQNPIIDRPNPVLAQENSNPPEEQNNRSNFRNQPPLNISRNQPPLNISRDQPPLNISREQPLQNIPRDRVNIAGDQPFHNARNWRQEFNHLIPAEQEPQNRELPTIAWRRLQPYREQLHNLDQELSLILALFPN